MLLGVQFTGFLPLPLPALFLARCLLLLVWFLSWGCQLAFSIPGNITDILSGVCTREPVH